jgi:hypothetical protein
MLPPVAAASLAALLFLSLLVATPAAPCQSACDVCFCAGPGFGNLTLQCVPDLVNITAIPCNIQPNITVLSIVDASITALAAGPLQALSNLTMLYLSSNRITRVDATALANQCTLPHNRGQGGKMGSEADATQRHEIYCRVNPENKILLHKI